MSLSPLSKVWKYERGNQKPVTEEQTIQLPNEKIQNDKQQSTKYYTESTVLRCIKMTNNNLQNITQNLLSWGV